MAPSPRLFDRSLVFRAALVFLLISSIFAVGCTTGTSEAQLAVGTLSGGLPTGSVSVGGGAYPATTLTASGGASPYTWAVTSGSLPTGLALSAAGTISGTPAAAGTYNFTVTVTDSQGHTAQGNLSIVINAALAVGASGTTLADIGVPGSAYPGSSSSAASLSITGGSGTLATCVVNSGSLPTGLSTAIVSGACDITGTIGGSVTPGSYTFTVKVTDSQGDTVTSGNITITVDPAVQIATPTLPLPNGAAGVNYPTTELFTASGGSGSGYKWTIASGSLPTGLNLSSATGATTSITAGPPTTAGAYPFTLKVTDSQGFSATTGNLSITINPAISVGLAPTSPVTLDQGKTQVITATVSNDPTIPAPGVTWKITSGPGSISTSTSTSATYQAPASVTTAAIAVVTATSVTDPTKSASFTINLVPPPTITTTSMSAGTATFAYSGTVSMTGGVAPYSWVLVAGPAGLSLGSSNTSTVAVQGTPTTAGANQTFIVQVTDTQGLSVTSTGLTITVLPAPAITSFAPAAATITAGGSTTLTGVFSNGTGAINNGVGAVTSGTPITVTPAATTTYTLTVTNTAGASVTQQTTITVVAAPTITSFTPQTVTITNGLSTTLTPVFSNGTGVITPGNIAATSGQAVTVSPTTTTTYTLTVSNAAITPATVTSTSVVTVVPAPAITSFAPSPATIVTGSSATLTGVFSGGTGVITPGNIPATSGQGVTVSPTATTTYTLTVTNAATTPATTTATTSVTVDVAPQITSATSTTFTVGANGSFLVTTTGTPSAALTESGALPNNVKFLDNGNGTATLSGIPATGTAGSYPITITANNGVSPNFVQNFTLNVVLVQAPTITSANSVTFTSGVNSSFTVTTSGSPTAAITEVGSLPGTVALVDNRNGTATISGTPTGGTASYPITITANNGVTPNGTQTFTLSVVPAPAITSFSPAAGTITVGGSTTLTPVFTGGTGVITPGNISATTGQAVTVSPAANTTYTLTVTNAATTPATATLTTSVTVVPAPTITSFVPAAASITAGNSTTLTGVFGNGTGVITPGNISATSGQAVTVSPTSTTTYTLTVTNSAGTAVTLQTTVTVVPAPAITSFVAGAATITAGNSTSLTAVFTGGTGSINNSVGAVTSNSPVSVSPAITTTYTLTVTNSLGANVTQQVTVTVVAAPAITSFVAAAPTITAGSSTTLTGVFSNGTGVITPGNISATSGQGVTVTPASTTLYTLTVTNAAGTAVTLQATVTVVAAPAITSFAAAAPTITAGNSTTLTAVFSGGTGVITPGNISATSGQPVTVSPAATTTYTLTVTNSATTPATTMLTTTVTVVPAPAISSFVASATPITAGTPVTLTGIFSNGTGVITPGNIAATSGQGVSVSPVATTTYTLTVTNSAGTTATLQTTVTVVAAPAITSFTPAATTITLGNSTTLTAVFSGGTGSINNSVGTVNSNSPVIVTPSVTTTYTLTVTNSLGASVTQQITVTVIPPQLVFKVQPSNIIPGGTITPAVQVAVEDNLGNTLASYTSTITIAISNNPSSGTLSGTLGVAAVSGVATFSNLSINNAGNNYTLSAVASGVTGAVSSPFSVEPSCTTNCTLSGNVVGPASGPTWVQDLTIMLTPSGGGSAINSLPTSSTGAYSFSGLASGTYNISGSQGYTYSPASITINGDIAGENITATPAINSYSISGTVSYSSASPKTGNIIIRVYQGNCTGCGVVAGASIPNQGGAFTSIPYMVRGLPPTSNQGGTSSYIVYAQIDTLNNGTINESNPEGNSGTVTLPSSNATNVNFTISNRTPESPVTPKQNNFTVSPGNGAAVIQYKAPSDNNGEEIATSYKVYYGTDTNASNGANSPLTFKADGQNSNVFFFKGLANGLTYFKLSAVNSQGESATTTPISTTIGTTTGNYTVSGTVTFPAGTTFSGPLYVGVYSNSGNGIYADVITSPTNPQSWTVSGVPNGTYQNFAILDNNNDGEIDAGDLDNVAGNVNPPTVVVNGANVAAGTVALSNASATTVVATSVQGSSGQPNSYSITTGITPGTKLPVSMTLFSGPNVAVPYDMNADSNNVNYNPIFNNSVSPNVGNTYQFFVTFSDGSTQVISAQVTAVLTSTLTSYESTLAMNTTASGASAIVPLLTWSAPTTPPAATPYTYSVGLYGTNGANENWNYSGAQNSNGIPSDQTSVLFNIDNSASPSGASLIPGDTYNWYVQVQDANYNSAQYTTTYTVPSGVGPASKLVFTQQPGNATAGSAMPNVQVTVEDASGNTVTSANNTITIVLGPGSPSATLSGTPSLTPTAGVATFSGLSINNAGTGYTLTAASSGFTTITSNTFSVGATGSAPASVSLTVPGPIFSGGNSETISISVANDQAGDVLTVTPTIGGNACTISACGTFGAVSGTSGSGSYTVSYTPPASVPIGNITLTVSPSLAGSFAGTGTITINPAGAILILSGGIGPRVVPNGTGTENLTVTVYNDVGNAGATIVLWASGYACPSVSGGTMCGNLTITGTTTGTTTTATTGVAFTRYTLTYTNPSAIPSSPYDRPMILAVSNHDPTKFAVSNFLISNSLQSSLVIPLASELDSALTGNPATATTLTANLSGDTGINKTVNWTLSNNGSTCTAPCTNAAGTLGTPAYTRNGNSVTATINYTPPTSVPESSSSATIAATSVDNSAATDSFNFNIVNGACGTGNSGVLSGNYAFLLKGSGAGNGYNVFIGSFFADGNGNITSGLQDINRTTGSTLATFPNGLTLTGTYSVGSDNRGCITWTNSNGATQTFRIALGTLAGAQATATQGAMTNFSDNTGQGPRMSGILLQQNPSAFNPSAFNGTYVFGRDGVDAGGGRYAIAGLATANGATSTLSNISLDYDDEITGAGNVPGPGSGTFSLATNAQGGRGTIQTTITVSSSAVTDHFVEYVVSPSEILSMSTDPIDSTHPIQSGEVKLQTGSPFPTTTLDNKNYVLSMSGVDGSNGGSMTQLGLVTFGTSGNAGITFDTNDNGTEQAEQHNALGSGISFDVTSTGRTTILGTGGTAPILYLVDSTQGFLVSTKPAGSTISSGYFQQQTGSSLPTQAFFGGTAPTTGSQFDSGTAVFNAGNPALTGTLSGTDDGSSPANNGGLNPNSPIENNGTPIAYTFVASNPPPNVASFSPTAPGQGLFGSDILAYIVSPTKVVFMQIGATFGFGGYTPANITGGTPVNPAELYTGQQ